MDWTTLLYCEMENIDGKRGQWLFLFPRNLMIDPMFKFRNDVILEKSGCGAEILVVDLDANVLHVTLRLFTDFLPPLLLETSFVILE